LATAISKTKAVGRCSFAGDPSFDVAFIQMVVTPTGRQIIFIASRPLQPDEVSSSSDPQSFDLMVGEFDMNDADNTKSTGFLYPASRLVVDEQGESHYDLAGSPWSWTTFSIPVGFRRWPRARHRMQPARLPRRHFHNLQ